jgi:hypothetical protein
MTPIREPKLADGIRDLYQRGWFTTFKSAYREPVERAHTSTQLVSYFLRHLLKQSAQSHAAYQLRERCKPILRQARERGCLYFKLGDTRTSLVLTFNNGADMQYTRSLGLVRLSEQYGVYPDWVYLKVAVQNFFLYQGDIEPMYHGVPRHRNKLAGARQA